MNLKYKYLPILIFFFVLIALTSYSQKIGIIGGSTLSDMFITNERDDIYNDFIWRRGYHFGILSEINIKNKVLIEPRILYTTKGMREDSETPEEIVIKTKVDFDVTYIDIQLPIKYKFKTKKISAFLLGGLYSGIGLKGHVSGEGLAKTQNGIETYERDFDFSFGRDVKKDKLRKIDIGVVGGLGIEYKGFQLSTIYSLGLANISTYQENGTIYKNRTLMFSFGYLYLIPSKN